VHLLPEEEPPFFRTSEDQDRAATVQCPLHGKRFELRFHIYVAKWRWESELEYRLPRSSAQYRKAFAASFPEGHPLREAIANHDHQYRIANENSSLGQLARPT
jgi:hypothetical protein